MAYRSRLMMMPWRNSWELPRFLRATVRWRVERIGNRQCFAGGALDDPAQIEVGGEMYADEALPWARLGCEISVPNAPDANFISELREKGQKYRTVQSERAANSGANARRVFECDSFA